MNWSKRLRPFYVMASVFVFLLQPSCGNYSDPKNSGGGTGGGLNRLTSDTLGFESIKAIVFESDSGHCLNCHSGKGGDKGRVNLETYARTLAVIGAVKDEVDGNTMPADSGPLADYERQVLMAWIAIGAPETSDVPLPQQAVQSPDPVVPAPPAEPVTPPTPVDPPPPALNFALVSEKIFTPYCVRCHASFANYTRVQRRIDDIFLQVSTDKMPDKGPPLSADLKELLKKWIDAGIPEN